MDWAWHVSCGRRGHQHATGIGGGPTTLRISEELIASTETSARGLVEAERGSKRTRRVGGVLAAAATANQTAGARSDDADGNSQQRYHATGPAKHRKLGTRVGPDEFRGDSRSYPRVAIPPYDPCHKQHPGSTCKLSVIGPDPWVHVRGCASSSIVVDVPTDVDQGALRSRALIDYLSARQTSDCWSEGADDVLWCAARRDALLGLGPPIRRESWLITIGTAVGWSRRCGSGRSSGCRWAGLESRGED